MNTMPPEVQVYFRIARLISECAIKYVGGSSWIEPTYSAETQGFQLHFAFKGEKVELPLALAEVKAHERPDSITVYFVGMALNRALEERGIDWRAARRTK